MTNEAYARNSDPETSHAAAAEANVSEIELQVIRAMKNGPESGMTTLDLSRATGILRDCVSPRLKPMVRKGLVVDSSLRKKSDEARSKGRRSIVWKLTELGRGNC